MTSQTFPRRLLAALLLSGLVFMTAASSGQAQAPPGERDKQIADLEKQLAELQAKLKSLKEQPTGPKKLTPAEEIVPESWVKQFTWRNIGPATMGGRITGLAVCESDPTTYYVATASGGVLKTTNNGISFEHLFDKESTVSIGAIAVAPTNKDIVWVGTGEANPRNSVSWGDGVYKSTDGGKKWVNMGLKTSFQIGSIVVHPKNPDVVYVGALGRLYGPGGERGLFKTEDGGKTWKNILPAIDDKTGIIDIALSPSNPELLIVAAWERQRDEFDSFLGDAKSKAPGGADEYAPVKVHAPGSALYKSTDGGKNFTKLSKGLPTVKLGRMGLDWSKKTPNTIFAIIDTEKAGSGPPPATAYLGIGSEDAKGMPGVLVTSTTADAPAAKAGIKEKDIITAIGGVEIKTYAAMIDDIRKRKPKEKAKFTLLRGKDKVEVEVTFTWRPEFTPSFGAQIEESEKGLALAEVLPKSSAELAGLKAGDVVKSINGNAIANRRDLFMQLNGKAIEDVLKVSIIRGKETKTIDVTLLPIIPERPYGDGQLGGSRPNVQDQQGTDGFQAGGLYKSTDAGESWTRINSINPRPFYFSTVRVDPQDDNTLYVAGVKLARSTDAGKTFSQDGINTGVHDDHHALWINPKDPRHLIAGTDGGFYVSYDKGARWDHMNHAGAIGQPYHVSVDNRTPYRIYCGLQDNGSWMGPSISPRGGGAINDEWVTTNWGDGFVCRVDPLDQDIIYAESQDGNLMRRNLRTGGTTPIRPRSQPGAGTYRFNWNTPYILSASNPMTYYCAGNYVFKSIKRGDDLQLVSPEITRTKRGSATALAESPRNPDVLYVGTDDGAVWVTRDGCKTWNNITDKFTAAGLPGPRWVATIEASKWADGRAFVCFDGHRSNDEAPYVFVTEDYGTTWTSLKANLPVGSTRVLREDVVNPNLLYLGTEFACYASINLGKAWTKLNGNGLPTVAVHEFAQPTTANDLVLATHGRSIWILDVTALRQMTPKTLQETTALLIPSPVVQWKTLLNYPFGSTARRFEGQVPARGAQIDLILAKKADKITLAITDVSGKTIADLSVRNEAGYQRVTWTPGFGGFGRRPGGGGGGGGQQPKGPIGKGPIGKGPNAPATEEAPVLNPLARPTPAAGRIGTYRVVLTVDGKEYVEEITIKGDPTVPSSTPVESDEVEEERQLRKKLQKVPEGRGDL